MKCDKCGKASVYRSTYIVNGISQTINLCGDCAIKEGVFNSTSIFEDMLSPFFGFMPFERVEDVVCPVCKTSLRQFKISGKLGCANCYETFRSEVKNIVAQIAKNSTHKQELIQKPKTSKQTKTSKMETLRAEMAQAVKEERYEDAAKIKRQIQKLEAKDE